jgi:hypothetical protein
LKRLEETCLKVDGKSHHHSEKREYKHAERMEKAKRRVEQIRAIIGSIDPANLNSTSSESRADVNNGASSSNESTAQAQATVPSPETIRLLSGAIAGCLQPCSLINKILNDVIGMIPQMESVQPSPQPPPYTETDQQQQKQQPESPRPSTSATNTSYVNTPVAITQASNEIEALFKEAAKELEKMNEIVNNTTAKTVMETSATSSTTTATTQIENTFANINDSGTSNATVIIAPDKSEADGPIDFAISMLDEEFKSITPSKSIRSRESSIEVHDVNSLMSDDSRDCWTILDQEEMSVDNIAPSNTPSRIVDFSTGAIPKHSTSVQVDMLEQEDAAGSIPKNSSAIDNASQVEMPLVSIETQTPTSLMSNETKMELQASVQKSIDIVQKSLETIQKTMENAQEKLIPPPVAATTPTQTQQADVLNETSAIPLVAPTTSAAPASAPPYGFLYPKINQQQESQANEVARRGAPNKTLTVKFEPAVMVYDPNPKINAAVHTMMNMGFNNEGNWLTQLLINVDGDVQKAINFLTPQAKPSDKNK